MSSTRKYIPENSNEFLSVCEYAKRVSKSTGEYWSVEKSNITDIFYITNKYSLNVQYILRLYRW